LSTYKINLPIDETKLKKLKAGDTVYLTGKLLTARDRAHSKATQTQLPFKGVDTIYHCGPLIKDGRIVSAGPTTSSRMNDVALEIINKYGIKILIGKGGMDPEVLKNKAIYLTMTGGCGALAAKNLKIIDQKWKELGAVESLYLLEAKEFGPLVVGIDFNGNSLYPSE